MSYPSPDLPISNRHSAVTDSIRHLQCGDLTVNPAGYQVRYRGRVLPLRPSEFRLLAHFVANPDQVFTRADLIRRLGSAEEQLDERTVDVWIGRLRRALRAHGVPDPLRTVRTLGYVLDSPLS